MQILSLRWYAKYGHFLRAEANANALSYPVPPRTAALGMLAAILGLEKDTLPEVLGNVKVAIGGALPQRFWHRIKLRKDPPTALPLTVKKGQKGSTGSDEKATLILQEWMWKPSFLIHVAMPNDLKLFAKLCKRVSDKQWYFGPCMGLSELLAEVELVGISEAKHLPAGKTKITSIFPQLAGRVLSTNENGINENLGINLLRMPYSVDSQRIFSHKGYYLEHHGRDLTVETDQAWEFKVQKDVMSVVFC